MMWFSVWGSAAMFCRILLCSTLLALSACGTTLQTGLTDAAVSTSTAVPVLIGLDALSVINTKKTIDDHFVSWVTGDDCSTVRASRGEPYCQVTLKPGPVVQRTAYCYKTLAAISCYDKPVPSDAERFIGTRTDDVPLVKP